MNWEKIMKPNMNKKAIVISAILFLVLLVGQISMLMSETNYIQFLEHGTTEISKVKILEEIGPVDHLLITGVLIERYQDPINTTRIAFKVNILKGEHEGEEMRVGVRDVDLQSNDINSYDEVVPYYWYNVNKLRENIGKNLWMDIGGETRGVRGIGSIQTFWESKIGKRLLSIIVIDILLFGLVFIFRKSRFLWLPASILFLGFIQFIFFMVGNFGW